LAVDIPQGHFRWATDPYMVVKIDIFAHVGWDFPPLALRVFTEIFTFVLAVDKSTLRRIVDDYGFILTVK